MTHHFLPVFLHVPLTTHPSVTWGDSTIFRYSRWFVCTKKSDYVLKCFISEPHQYIIKILFKKRKKKGSSPCKEKKKIKYKKFRLLLLNKFNQESRETLSLLSFSPPSLCIKKPNAVGEAPAPGRGDGTASGSARTRAAAARRPPAAAWPPWRSAWGNPGYGPRRGAAALGSWAAWRF